MGKGSVLKRDGIQDLARSRRCTGCLPTGGECDAKPEHRHLIASASEKGCECAIPESHRHLPRICAGAGRCKIHLFPKGIGRSEIEAPGTNIACSNTRACVKGIRSGEYP